MMADRTTHSVGYVGRSHDSAEAATEWNPLITSGGKYYPLAGGVMTPPYNVFAARIFYAVFRRNRYAQNQ